MATGEGFHDFYRDAYPRLVAQLYAVTTDLGLAEDVVQEAFVRAASRWSEVSTYQARRRGSARWRCGCAWTPHAGSDARRRP